MQYKELSAQPFVCNMVRRISLYYQKCIKSFESILSQQNERIKISVRISTLQFYFRYQFIIIERGPDYADLNRNARIFEAFLRRMRLISYV